MWASRPLTCRARADTGTCGSTTTRSARASSLWWTPRTKCVHITCFHESSISYLLLFFREKVVFSIKKITVILAFYVFSSSLVWTCRILNICFDFFHRACLRKQQQIFKIRHVQIYELPRTL